MSFDRAMVPAPPWSLHWRGRCSSSQISKQRHLKGLGNGTGLPVMACRIEGLERKCYVGSIGSRYQSLEIISGFVPWWLKAPRSPEPTFKAGAQSGCHVITKTLPGSAKIIVNDSCKSVQVQVAEEAHGTRLHEEVDMSCGSQWVGDPRRCSGQP